MVGLPFVTRHDQLCFVGPKHFSLIKYRSVHACYLTLFCLQEELKASTSCYILAKLSSPPDDLDHSPPVVGKLLRQDVRLYPPFVGGLRWMCLCERLCHNEVDEQTLVSCQLLSWSNPSVSLFVATLCISALSKLDLFTQRPLCEITWLLVGDVCTVHAEVDSSLVYGRPVRIDNLLPKVLQSLLRAEGRRLQL